MFYEFVQNNSGGSFVSDLARGISTYVVIEATDHEHANVRAKEVGLYFDGISAGQDCSCCGDRWYPAVRSDSDDFPAHYGVSLVEANVCPFPWKEESAGTPVLYVHLLSGLVLGFHAYEERLVYLGPDLPVSILG